MNMKIIKTFKIPKITLYEIAHLLGRVLSMWLKNVTEKRQQKT